MIEGLKEFKRDVLRNTPGSEIESGDFYAVYRLWCLVGGQFERATKPAFNQAMQAMGYKVKSGRRTRLVIYDVSPRIGREK